MYGLKQRYKDVGNERDKFFGLYYRDAVEQGIDNLLRVRKGERLFRPDFGSDLDDIIFDPAHEITEYWLINKLYGILVQEERIKIRDIKVTKIPDQHLLDVYIEYEIKGSGEAFIYRRKITV